MGKHRYSTPLEPRFWAKVDKRGPDDCWLWTASILKNGYGHIGIYNKKTDTAHRVSYRLAKGEIPPGMDVCHTCDVRACVNPAHLFLGTRAENMADCKAKGRARGPNYRGEKIGTSKLKEPDVLVIKRKILAGISNTVLGEQHGVSRATIDSIRKGDSWRHVKLDGKPCVGDSAGGVPPWD